MSNAHLIAAEQHGIATAVCAGCLTRVHIHELAGGDGKCEHCREIKARTGLDNDGQMLGADAGVHLDLRSFDGGDSLATCDEI